MDYTDNEDIYLYGAHLTSTPSNQVTSKIRSTWRSFILVGYDHVRPLHTHDGIMAVDESVLDLLLLLQDGNRLLLSPFRWYHLSNVSLVSLYGVFITLVSTASAGKLNNFCSHLCSYTCILVAVFLDNLLALCMVICLIRLQHLSDIVSIP